MDLLHTPGAVVSVSSVVANATDRPENLVDGRLETAWSSRTGQLEGATVYFQLPADATVRSLRLTAGMTRTSDAGDLFTMNPRIRAVELFREDESVGTFRLDTESRALQSFPVNRPGGSYRVVVREVLRGTQRRWREVSISELAVYGTRADLSPSVPAVRVGPLLPDALPTAVLALGESAAIPDCFAWSPRTNSAACVFAARGHNLELAHTDYPGLSDDNPSLDSWELRFLGASAPALRLGGYPDAPFPAIDQPPPAERRAAVNAALARGGYVSLDRFLVGLAPGDILPWGSGGSFRFLRRTSYPGGDNAAPRYASSVSVRFTGNGPWQNLETRASAPTGTQSVTVALVPGGRWAVVHSFAEFGDEGETGIESYAWRCDFQERRCEP